VSRFDRLDQIGGVLQSEALAPDAFLPLPDGLK
jgi:hypothetical protein